MRRPRFLSHRADSFAFPPGHSICRSHHHQLFRAEGGEVCAALSCDWDALLSGMSELGPVALITHNRSVRLAMLVEQVDFAHEPLSDSYIELQSGLIADPQEWTYALAVQENLPSGAIFGFQFFDRTGQGQLKVVLTREAQLEHFFAMVEEHGVGGYPPACAEEPPSRTSDATPPLLPGRTLLRGLWKRTRHETGGRFFPGLPGITRLAALQNVGDDLARPITLNHFLATLMALRRKRLPARFTLFNRHLTHGVNLRARQLERCPQGVHLFDSEGEFHLSTESPLLYWLIRDGGQTSFEIIAPCGERVALVSGAPGREIGWEHLLAKNQLSQG
ncbi:MAG TPA: ChuX/HutX family heme-like substrate-binding protein [Chthoniobacteraceae bacterium]|nr:ChuX/HutX family heme-like substrate-binding protein [Chthoniobacteraceae bacterium]